MMRSSVRQAVIVTDATRFEFNRQAACGVALLLSAGAVMHCWCLAELVALCLPFCVHVRAAWWVQTMIWAFFLPFVSAGALSLTVAGGSPLSNLVLSLFYFGFPAGFVCLLFVSLWIAVGQAGRTLGTALVGIRRCSD